jgi:hypothetical protein
MRTCFYLIHIEISTILSWNQICLAIRPLSHHFLFPTLGLSPFACAFLSALCSQVDSIELVGGGSRVLGVRKALKEFFGRELSTTCNADESVARGCALQVCVRVCVCRVLRLLLFTWQCWFCIWFVAWWLAVCVVAGARL